MNANRRKPIDTNVIPAATVRFEPKRALIRGVRGATIIMIGAIGKNRTAAERAL